MLRHSVRCGAYSVLRSATTPAAAASLTSTAKTPSSAAAPAATATVATANASAQLPTVSAAGNATAVLTSSPSAPIPGLLASLPSPYATDGGHVPIYSIAHGAIHKRYWLCRNAQWCEICKEPVAQWLNHMGRKDHSLLDMHYGAMVEWPRRWSPESVLRGLLSELGCTLDVFHRHYADYDREHRGTIYAMLIKLEEAGMVYFNDARTTYLGRMQGSMRGLDLQGALVLHELLLGPFLHLYPGAQIQDLSNLIDFVTCSYNLETVYDLCGFYTLDKVALKLQYKASSPAALGLGGIATSSGVTTGYSSQPCSYGDGSEDSEGGGGSSSGEGGATRNRSRATAMALQMRARQQEDRDEEAFSRKAVFMRQLLGQLRWLLTPQQEHPAGYTFPPHIMVLGENCLKALVVELLVARVCEYMVRAEPVWRSFGFERKRLDMKRVVAAADDVVPKVIRYTYRAMSPRHDDFYSDKGDVLDEEVRTQLRRKDLPIPPAFATRAQRGDGGANARHAATTTTTTQPQLRSSPRSPPRSP